MPSRVAEPCEICATTPPPFAATVAALVYAHPVDRLLQSFKYRGQLALADWAGAALATAVRDARAARVVDDVVDGVVPIPLTPARQRERGFNQAREIGARVAHELALPMVSALAREGTAPPQALLVAHARRHNVLGSFAACADVRGARFALVDDVMTTGATLAAAATVLRDAGAEHVECWVVARTPRPGQP